MKKFLSMLLALSVVFTYTFGAAGSVFAATNTLSTDERNAIKAYAEEKAATYYEKIEKAGETYIDGLTFDEDGYLTAVNASTAFVSGASGIAQKSVIVESKDDAVVAAKTAFNQAVAGFDYTDTDYDTKAEVDAALQAEFATAVSSKIADAVVIGVDGSSKIDLNKVVAAQYKIDKAAAEDAIAAINLDNYSNVSSEWSKALASGDAPLDATNFNFNYYALGGFSGTPTVTAYELVKAIVDTQSAAIAGATTKNIASITTMRAAANKATVAVLGHLKTVGANWYVAPIPTKDDLAKDTTVAGAKATAINQIKADMASKKITLNSSLQSSIDAYKQNASLSATDKATLAALQEKQAKLDDYFAAAEEVYTANINYKKTTTAVDAYVGATAASGKRAEIAGLAVGGPTDVATVYSPYITIVKNVASLKAEVANM